MNRRSDVIAVSILVFAACGGGDHDEGGKYRLAVTHAPPGTTVLVSGKPAGVLDTHSELEITLPKGVYLGDGKGAVAVRLDTPCGPKDVAFPAKDPADFEVEKANRTLTHAEYSSVALPADVVFHTFWVDRTRAPGAKVTVGGVELRPAMEWYQRIMLVWPACEDGRVVRVDGKEVGKLPIEAPKDQELVIATAPGCYRLREIAYVKQGSYGRGLDDVMYARTQLAWVRPLNYFLKAAPSDISSDDVSETRNELLAVECGTKPRSARR